MDNKVIQSYFRCLHRKSKNVARSQYALIVLQQQTKNSVVQQNPITTGTRQGKRQLPIPQACIQTAKPDTDWEESATAMCKAAISQLYH